MANCEKDRIRTSAAPRRSAQHERREEEGEDLFKSSHFIVRFPGDAPLLNPRSS